MARGPSGRIIIEVNPAFKRDLHSALAADGLSLKDWFLKQGADYLSGRKQPALPGMAYTTTANEPALLGAEAAEWKSTAP
jgi:hypothetical protein